MICLRGVHNEATAQRKEVKKKGGSKGQVVMARKETGPHRHSDDKDTSACLSSFNSHRAYHTHSAYIIVTVTHHGELITHLLMTEHWSGSH